MLQTLKTRFNYRWLSFLLIPAVILIAFFSANHFTTQAHASGSGGYGGCPSEVTCIWSGHNYTGQEAEFGGGYCTPEYYDQFNTFGFTGVGSYSGSENSPAITLYYYSHGQPHGAFTILSGAAHHSSNTDANPWARYVSAVFWCGPVF